jgi:hypothetical protein
MDRQTRFARNKRRKDVYSNRQTNRHTHTRKDEGMQTTGETNRVLNKQKKKRCID